MFAKRKEPRLAGYNYSQPGIYFITVCTKDRIPMLSTIVGGDDHIAPSPRLTHIGRVVDKYLKMVPGIGPYVIMPNHIHMLLRISAEDIRQGPVWEDAPAKANVSSMIRTWKTMISKEIGQSIWQRSFYDHIIRDEHDYLTRVQYIENNPAKWQEDSLYRASVGGDDHIAPSHSVGSLE